MNPRPASIDDLICHIAALAEPGTRRAAARALAPWLGARDLMIFVRDDTVARSLPAPGFPRTLREGRTWMTLVERAVAEEESSGTVTVEDGRAVPARAIGLTDGTVLVLLDVDRPVDVRLVRQLLPLAGNLFRSEASLEQARTEVRLARQSATESAAMAAQLDIARAELRSALNVAEQATRARDEFLATVSHELRTPLTSIIGWMQLLRDETNPQIIAEAHETIERNARAQNRLVEDILDFSRITGGRLRLDVRRIDLIEVIEAALDIVRPAANAKAVRFDSVLDPNAGPISGDPDRLQQIIWNLLSNAVKFTPRGGRVQIRLERVNSHVELSVSDSGEGIDPHFLPQVFDRFSQANAGTNRIHSGLGLGLSIARHLVELHGGTIHAFSGGLGQGATFTVHLPVAALAENQLTTEQGSALDESVAPFDDLTGISALILEDNEDSRKLLEAILLRSGARVRAVENTVQAFRALREETPDIIISDVEMPEEDGYQFMRRVRRDQSQLRYVPAIAVTAFSRSIDRVRTLAAGFQMHMTKPIEPAELTAAVKSLVTATRTPPLSPS